ncbi:MAG: hypothetical protein U0271_41740 [Polyangiaceae bacterium]
MSALSVETQRRLQEEERSQPGKGVHDLAVEGGVITAKVTETVRRDAHTVRALSISLNPVSEEAWAQIVEALAAKAYYSVELLANRLPAELEGVFSAAGVSLLPAGEADVTTECTCRGWRGTCRHLAATHWVLSQAIDRDPSLILEFRGRTRQQLLDEVRAARVGESLEVEAGVESVATVDFAGLSRKAYDQYRAPLQPMHFEFDPPAQAVAVLRQLGLPAGWPGVSAPADILRPFVVAASETARTMALAPAESLPLPEGGYSLDQTLAANDGLDEFLTFMGERVEELVSELRPVFEQRLLAEVEAALDRYTST